MNSLIVSAECPLCSAPLDFSHGSNAVKCGHCGSNLLVTGRKQLLSYFVTAKLEERRAIALAMKAQRDRGLDEFSGIKAQLYFLPYYRMTGHEFGWEKSPPRPSTSEIGDGLDVDEDADSFWMSGQDDSSPTVFYGSSLMNAAGKLFGLAINNLTERLAGAEDGSLDKSPLTGDAGKVRRKSTDELPAKTAEHDISISKQLSISMGTGSSLADKTGFDISISRRLSTGRETCGHQECGGSLYDQGELLLKDRYLEKNFIACGQLNTVLYSLGVRPAVLRLELFRKSALDSLGKAVSPDLSAQAADVIGLKALYSRASLYRKVIGKVLSLIYFPFWVVELKCRSDVLVTVIDAVSSSVLNTNAGTAIYETLDRAQVGEPTVAAFRPLTCPNCGWDLPVRPEDCIFFCGNCSRAWQIFGSDLNGVAYHIADSGDLNKGELKYLPFWILKSAAATGQSFNFFIPAFRYRRLKFLLELALIITRLQPEYSVSGYKASDLSGCCYDSADAASLAQFTQAALISDSTEDFKTELADSLSVTGATLVWFPFRIQGEYLIAPFGGIRIPGKLLI